MVRCALRGAAEPTHKRQMADIVTIFIETLLSIPCWTLFVLFSLLLLLTLFRRAITKTFGWSTYINLVAKFNNNIIIYAN